MQRLKDKFRFFSVDTSSPKFNKPQKACVAVVGAVLNWIEELLQEDILSLPRDSITATFKGTNFLAAHETEGLVKDFLETGEFIPRDLVEADGTR
ncbi:MAG: hypothetical protein ACRESG_09400, partial [Gammaproteobacteria bacterium]